MSGRVDQYVYTFRARDAVSDEARLFRDRLRERGFASSIVAVNAEPAVAHEVEPFVARGPSPAGAVLYHHATAPALGLWLARRPGPKALLYHGVTPPAMLRPYQPALADALEAGRTALRRIAAAFPQRYADSRFGSDELLALAGAGAAVVPFCLDERRFAAAGGARDRRSWPRGAGWLSVGRIAPNKGLLALIAAFGVFARDDAAATLTLAGGYAPTDPYYWAVRAAIDAAGLYGRVRLTGSIDDAALVQLYEAADVYVCASEHEGFCVPLIEAMRFDLPVVALARAAVPETLGGTGVLVSDGAPEAFAAAVASLAGDERRAAVLAAQRLRREAFRPAAALAAFDRIVDALVAA